MPVSYTKTGGQGHVFSVPDYPEAADGPKAFKDFADFLDLILPPVGTIMPFVGNTSPTGWLLCDGAEYDQAAYPKLSALCGTKFSLTANGDAAASAGKFRVPNLKGRIVAGLDTSQTEFDTIGKKSGAKTVTLTVSNMPAHDHTATVSSLTASGEAAHTHGAGTFAVGGTGGHSHGVSIGTRVVSVTTDNSPPFERGTGSNLSRVNSVTATTNSAAGSTTSLFGETDGGHSHTFTGTSASGSSHTHTITGNITIENRGSGTAVNVLNPYITMNHIIRAA
jgi:microcystin-dependent protein